MKQTRGASKRIDRLFAGVGRIALSSGTDHGPTYKRINAMLTGLYKVGHLDILAAIRDGVHKPLVVLHLYERGQLDKLPSAETAQALLPSFRAFVEKHDCGKAQRRNMTTTVHHLEKLAGAKTAQVVELPRLLRTLKDTMRDRPVAFNKARAHALTFLSELQGIHSPVWIELSRIKRFKKQPTKAARRPLTVAELDAVCATFRDHPVYGGKKGAGNKGDLTVKRTIWAGDLAAMTWALATTGMRPSEYWQRNGASWSVAAGFVDVQGTKTRAAVRPTFWLPGFLVTEPACGEQFYRKQFRAATEKALGVGLDVYSLRRTFSALCESAGVVDSRRDAYMGHGPETVADLYLQTQVLPFVREDGEKFAQFVRAERERAAAPPLRLEKNG